MANVLALHRDLAAGVYVHGPYWHFKINDPKLRDIHKASVRDRLMHHAIYRALYPLFDRTFIPDAYSCRVGRGAHRAMNAFRAYAYKASKNHTKTLWVLKCDIRKFFASIDHAILLAILKKHICDERPLDLLERVIKSFETLGRPGKGLPLGNLTSQLFANVYLNELDQFVKHRLKARYYVRYADDFALLSPDRDWLLSALPYMEVFLREQLALELHPDKVSLKTFAPGADFLGWVHFPDHRVLRTSTRRRICRNLAEGSRPARIASYRGMLSHGNAHGLLGRIPEPEEK